jgi:pyrroloquinoline quinone biosynthesis protein D
MNISTSTVLRRARDVRFRAVDDETVVIRQEAAEALVLNELAGRILDLIDGQRTVGAVVDRLLDEYDVEENDLAADVQEYLEELLATGVVVAP